MTIWHKYTLFCFCNRRAWTNKSELTIHRASGLRVASLLIFNEFLSCLLNSALDVYNKASVWSTSPHCYIISLYGDFPSYGDWSSVSGISLVHILLKLGTCFKDVFHSVILTLFTERKITVHCGDAKNLTSKGLNDLGNQMSFTLYYSEIEGSQGIKILHCKVGEILYQRSL